jgi:hypothetical protein
MGTWAPQELDVVRLDAATDRWPAGTEGTLVDAFSHGGVVEVSDEQGRMLDLVSVAYKDMTVVWSAALKRHVADHPSAVTGADGQRC